MKVSISSLSEQPVPKLKKLDWEDIKKKKIVECEEKLVPISLLPEKILVRPQYFLQGLKGALPECYCREGVFSRLVEATEKLPQGYKLVIFDAWRSPELQLNLFNKYKKELQDKYPDKSKEELITLAEQFIARPSKNPANPPPHSTGGSIDLTIVNDKGKFLKMGTRFDETERKTHTRYYEELVRKGIPLSAEEKTILYNRRLLFNIMTESGFTNYPQEWWHYDYGNQVWAYFNDSPQAIYGMVKPSFRWNKELC